MNTSRIAIVAAVVVLLVVQMSIAAGFRFEEVSDKSVKLWDGEKPIFVYNFGDITPKPNAKPRNSYLHPVYGLDGEVLTDDAPADHVNHRGIYWAWPHLKIGETEHDTWALRGVHYQFGKWTAKEAKPDQALLAMENGWFVGEKKVMDEKVSIRVHPAQGESRSIDLEFTWTPTDQPITLWGAEGKSYGGLSLRFGPRKKTVITTPSGRAPEDLVIARLPWADFSGDLRAPDVMSGAAVFVSPANPDFRPEWMTRSYGMLAVGWPGVKPKTLEAGKPVTFKYRLWIHRGNPEANEIQNAYDAYRAAKP